MGIRDKIKSGANGNGVVGWILGSGRKKVMAAGATAVVMVALVAGIILNGGNTGSYVVLFPRVPRKESNEILVVLSGRDVTAKRSSEGEVTVPEDQLGNTVIEMSELGYPKAALPFDTFSDNTGPATAESEKRWYPLMNLQDCLERTLKNVTGIKNTIITLNVSNRSTYVQEDEDPDSTNSVSLISVPSYDLSPERVSAVKNLVVDSVPRLAPERVIVVSAEAMQEMVLGDTGNAACGPNRLDLKAEVKERLQNEVRNMLTLACSPGKIQMPATVVIDHNEMMARNLGYEPWKNGQGVMDHYRENRGVAGSRIEAGGIVREEDNTDILAYGTAGIGGITQGTKDYYRDVDCLISYVRKQVEKDNVKLQKVTVTVTVDGDRLIESKKQQLVDAMSKTANTVSGDIVVPSFREVSKEIAPARPALPMQTPAGTGIDYWIMAITAGAETFLFLLILLLVLGRRYRRQMKKDQELFALFEGEVPPFADMEERAEEAAVQDGLGRIQVNPEDPVGWVRSFTRINPEVIVSMVSSWLKGGKR